MLAGLRQFASSLAFDLSLRRAFWRVKRMVAYAMFRLRLIRFSTRQFARRRLDTAKFLRQLFWAVAAPTVYALLLCAVAYCLDWYVLPYAVSRGMRLPVLDPASYITAASAIAATMGVLLGLYFTAIGVVVGGAYGRVATDVRQLAIRERISDRYLAIVALTCIFGLYLSGFQAAGLAPSPSGMVLLYAIATFAVFGFVQLGLRVYHFLDPELLAARINLDVFEAMHEVRIGRPHAEDSSFQAHHRRLIENALSTYGRLLDFVNGEPSNLAASKDLLKGLVLLLGIYNDLKSRIPAGSAWYRPQPEYESILASHDNTFVSVHLPTATMPPPRTGHDYLWFEKTTAALIGDNLVLHLRHGDAAGAYEVLHSLQGRLHGIAKSLAIEEALLVERALSSRVLEGIAGSSEPRANLEKPKEFDPAAVKIQLYDFTAFAPMQILLGLAERVASADPHVLVDAGDWRQWFLRKRYYHQRLPRYLLAELDTLASRLRFERSIEGRVTTGEWYLRERYAVLTVRQVATSLELVLQRIEAAYHPTIERLVAEKSSMAAMHVALRGLEICHKFCHHLNALVGWCDAVRSAHVHDEKALTFPDEEGLLKRVEVLETKLFDAIHTLAFSVYAERSTRESSLPDYFGHAYMLLGSMLFERMRENAAEAEGLFRAFFGLSVLAAQRLSGEVTTPDPITRFMYVTEPYRQLAELSGYAYLYSQLQVDIRLWRSVRALWRKAFKSYIKEEVIRLTFTEHLPMVRPWYASRHRWKLAFEEDLAAAVAEQRWFSPLLGVVRDRVLSWHGMSLFDASDVFFLVFLGQRRAFRSGKMPLGAESLAHAADRMADETR